jgi:hypothetical protein
MKKKLKKPSIRTINHRDGGMSFYAEGGEFDFVRNQGQKPAVQNQNEEMIMGPDYISSQPITYKPIPEVPYLAKPYTSKNAKDWTKQDKEDYMFDFYAGNNPLKKNYLIDPAHMFENNYATLGTGYEYDAYKIPAAQRYPSVDGIPFENLINNPIKHFDYIGSTGQISDQDQLDYTLAERSKLKNSSKQDYFNFLDSPAYIATAKKMWGDDYQKHINEQKTRIQNVPLVFAPYDTKNTEGWNSGLVNSLAQDDVAAFYDTVYNGIYVNNPKPRKDEVLPRFGTLYHELSHSTDSGMLTPEDALIPNNGPKETWQINSKYLKPNSDQKNDYLVEEENKMDPAFQKWKDKFPYETQYYKSATEVRARVNALRTQMVKDGFDWSTATQEQLMNYLNNIEDGDLMTEFGDLIGKEEADLSPAELLDLFQNYAANEKKTDTRYAENGGMIKMGSRELPIYATQGQVGPSLFPAPSLAFKNSVQNFVAKEDAKKKAIIKEQEELQKQTKNKKVIATLQPNYNNAMHTDTTGPYGNGYTQEQQRYFESKNIPTHLWAAEQKKIDDAAIVARRKQVQQQAVKDLEKGQFNNTSARAENLTNAFRLFPEDPNSFIDDYLNPFQMVGSMAGNLGSHFANDAGPINPWALALDIASPLAVGTLAGLGSLNTKQFVNNIVNPVAGFSPFEGLTKRAKRGLLNFIDRRLGEDSPVFQFKKQIGRDVDPGDIRTVVETSKKQALKDPSGFTRSIGSGAEEFESVIQSRLNDLTSEEGYKRLVNQEKEYLQSIKFKGSLDEQAAINAGARINELKNVVVSNRLAKDFFKTNRMKGEGLDKIINTKQLYNNAYYGPPDVSDDLYKPFGYKPTFGINLEKFPQLGGKIIPGELGIGYTNLGNVPIMHHEIAHALQRNRTMPIDTELSFIKPKSNLNSTDAAAYKYFMNGSKGHEPSAFANELRASMLQRGLIKNIYDPITPELLQKAHSSFMQKPIAKYQKLGKSTPGGFLTGHRIIDFMEPSMSNFNTLSQLMNKLPAVAPLGIGLGAALYNSKNTSLPQNQFGGGIELSNRRFDGGGSFNDPVSAPGQQFDLLNGVQKRKQQYEYQLKAEEARVAAAREKVIEVARKAAVHPEYRKEIFKTVLPDEMGVYCSTRSCELERAAGYTIPNDVEVFGRKITAGSKIPVIPGTKYFEANAPNMGYQVIPFSDATPGDRVMQLNKKWPYGHSMIYAGNDGFTENPDAPYFYYDSGNGKNFKYFDYPLKFDNDQYVKTYRYVGNIPALQKPIYNSNRMVDSLTGKNSFYEEGGEYELTNEEIKKLRKQGYDIELL